MQIRIYNSSDDHTIFPVLTMGQNERDKRLQAWFKVPNNPDSLKSQPYPRNNEFRLYINPTHGIPPHDHVTLILPLFTKLVPKIDATKPDQFADWWDGGNLLLFASKDGSPPEALTENYENRPSQVKVKIDPSIGAALPTCIRCEQQLEPTGLQIYKDQHGLANNNPSQLLEYTLGAIDETAQPYIELNDHNVDYDVSYVNTAYLPAAMGAVQDNPRNQIGYIGMITPIDEFETAVEKFLNSKRFDGWPRFTQTIGGKTLTYNKVPSPLELFVSMQNRDQDTWPVVNFKLPDNYTATPKAPGPDGLPPGSLWEPVRDLVTLWQRCVAGATDTICQNIVAVNQLMQKNYRNYIDHYHDKKPDKTFYCDQAKDPDPINLSIRLGHVYGWQPFNNNCPADWNLLQDTPGYNENNHKEYEVVKKKFDDLQYWPDRSAPFGRFNPYLLLIHGKSYLNAPYVYAYSVDDAVGNMQVDDAKGLIISVGGDEGLKNKQHATLPINFGYGWGKDDAVKFTHYSICTDALDQAVNPKHAAFVVYNAKNPATCPLWFKDDRDNRYTVTIAKGTPFRIYDPNTEPQDKGLPWIDCSGNADGSVGKAWCENVYVYTAVDVFSGGEKYYAIAGAPPQPPK